MSLTPNAINRMFAMSGSSEDPSFLPAVQVLHLKKIDQKGGADDRWKVSGYFMLSLFHVEMSYYAKVSASNAFLFSLSLSLSLSLSTILFGVGGPIRWNSFPLRHVCHPTQFQSEFRRNCPIFHYQNQ